MNTFVATNFMRTSDLKALAFVINDWEDWRCALSEEAVYNLDHNDDLMYFIEKYGATKAVEYYNKSRFWLDGNAFKEPHLLNFDRMVAIINDVYDEEHFKELIENGYEELYDKWFYMDKVKNAINPKKHYCVTTMFKSSDDKDEIKKKVESILKESGVSNWTFVVEEA